MIASLVLASFVSGYAPIYETPQDVFEDSFEGLITEILILERKKHYESPSPEGKKKVSCLENPLPLRGLVGR